ncbi:hypothetical protein GE09DRAFT_1109333 [Coniochaeta sp. 2T2.1]|nr:hypothetical protein GE09DRAFT_1109333 [Coniochaeta sp. 2T2.1]
MRVLQTLLRALPGTILILSAVISQLPSTSLSSQVGLLRRPRFHSGRLDKPGFIAIHLHTPDHYFNMGTLVLGIGFIM